MSDLFKGRRSRGKSFREILRLSGEQVDSIKQRGLWPQRASVIQNRDRLVKISILYFELRKLHQSRRDRRGFYFAPAQLSE